MSDVRVTIAGGAQWQEVAADRQRHRDATIDQIRPPVPDVLDMVGLDPTSGYPSPESPITSGMPRDVSYLPAFVLDEGELAITSSNAEDLVSKLASGEWSAVAVVNAFLRRAALAQKLTNCVTELLPASALKRAAELDGYLAAHGKPMGPLHGLPISVKEHIGMKGLDLNGAFVSWVGRVAGEDALLLRLLRDAGAVFHARTTEPQCLMHAETSNNLYGETVNPFNTSLTAGGSSGGEGALIAMRGSVLGVGTDIGGSIRSPAFCNGIFGFKPTGGRLPVQGLTAPMVGSEAIKGVIGPLSTSLEGLKLLTKTVLDRKPWLCEPGLSAMGWRDMSTALVGRKLKVAVMREDDVVRPHPPVARALENMVQSLQKSDKIELVEWKPWKHDLAWAIISSLYFCDGGAEIKDELNASKEPLRPLSHWILNENPHVKHHDIASLWRACAEREAYRAKYAELWNETARGGSEPVDVILCPAGPGAAPKLNSAKYWGYLSIWNLLDYPAAVFPVADAVSVEKDGAVACGHGIPVDEWQEHGAEGYSNAPLCLQLVGRRYDDEKLMATLEMVMKETGLPTHVRDKSPAA